MDLLIGIIPEIIKQFDHVNFIIGGDGDKMVCLKQLVERNHLEGRVELLGSLEHGQVRDALCRGHIFLNTSLTESFCIAILEAACCGLLVVSTDVGGVPEVLPPHMAFLAKPNVPALLSQLVEAINRVKSTDTTGFYDLCSSIYSWRQVALRTEKVYDFVMTRPYSDTLQRLKTAMSCGFVMGFLAVGFLVLENLFLLISWFFLDEKDIDKMRNFNSVVYNENHESYGDHRYKMQEKKRAQ